MENSFAPGSARGRGLLCPRCRGKAPPWIGCAYHGIYGGPLRDLCLRLKFDGQLYLSALLAGFMLEACQCLPKPDSLLAVPQHPAHLRMRGFNQAQELASMLAKTGGFGISSSLLVRVRQGRVQEGLTALQRRENLRGAFRASPEVAGLRLWLVDDIMTTGSTYTEACSALLQAGAQYVCAVFVARTPLP